MITKILSYGDTGANLAGLLAAERCGIMTGGETQKDYITEKGAQPLLKERFGLVESTNNNWTASNIEKAEATILFSNDSPFGNQVADYCRGKGIPCITINPKSLDSEVTMLFLNLIKPKTVNVVGELESAFSGITKTARDHLVNVFQKYQEIK